MTIDTEKAIIYGANGSASYYINDSGGLELIDIEGVITDEEYLQAETELKKG